MFDIGFMELCLIGVVALLVVGPERLPRLARSLGLWMGKARRFMADVKSDIKAEIDQQELASIKDIKKDLEQARDELAETSSSLSEKLTDEELMDHIETPPHLAAQTETSTVKKTGTKKKTRKKASKKSKTTAKKSSRKTAGKKKTARKKKTATAAKKSDARRGKKKKATKRARS